MNPKARISAKSFSPLFCIGGSSIVAAIIGVIVAILIASDFFKDDSMGYGKLAAPFAFIVTLFMFFFYAWSPVLGMALTICAVIPSLRRSAPLWIWICSYILWVVSLLPFCYCARIVRTTPGLAKYSPF
jgi:type III secretory pathway component EscS